jgi:hypothetical protein
MEVDLLLHSPGRWSHRWKLGKRRKKLGNTMRIEREREDMAGHREGRTENMEVCSTALTTWSVGG